MGRFDETLIRHFDSTFLWDILMGHFDGTFNETF